ncbi:hypothetical protein GUI12_02810 [Anaplasmataceae bacterium AB001_6]|nr:hypothetical protein GUI12_02810 [Anaplasmataceae bacterium AB001_6]
MNYKKLIEFLDNITTYFLPTENQYGLEYFLSELTNLLASEKTDSLTIDNNSQKKFLNYYYTEDDKYSDVEVEYSLLCKDIIPIVYGTVKIKGRVIWQKTYRNISNELLIKAAVLICEGKIDSVNNLWINDSLIFSEDHKIDFYFGEDDQECDPTLQEEIPITPAYYSCAYMVISDYKIEDPDNVEFIFEVVRNLPIQKNSNTALSTLTQAICITPSTGEFIYDTEIATKSVVFDSQTENMIINNNVDHTDTTDIIIALKAMEIYFPHVKWISIEVAWFCDHEILNEDFDLKPYVENKSHNTTPEWKVGTYNRSSIEVKVVGYDSHSNFVYGGTCNDQSIFNLVKELKNRGYKIFVQPKILINDKLKTHCSQIRCLKNGHLNIFFDKYQEFIVHYATLLKKKIHAFSIGYALKGITSFQNSKGDYVGIDMLSNLAEYIKHTIFLNFDILVTYSADWDEYHSHQEIYNMDALWMSSGIDFIGINAYFPLTDSLEGYQEVLNVSDYKKYWNSGLYYDYFYEIDNDTYELVKKYYDDSTYAIKNINHWWSNEHYNNSINKRNINKKTAWVPKAKPIWFTELGFPSIDCGTDNPSCAREFDKFSNIKTPDNSRNIVCNELQQNALIATLEYWNNSEMIEHIFVYNYDIRPFPEYPGKKAQWNVSAFWEYDMSLNGKMNGCRLKDFLADIFYRSPLKNENINFQMKDRYIDGFLIDKPKCFITILKHLECIYGLIITENVTGIYIKDHSQVLNEIKIINKNERLVNTSVKSNFKSYPILIDEIIFSYIDIFSKYKLSNINIKNSNDKDYNEGYDDKRNRCLSINCGDIFTKKEANFIANTIYNNLILQNKNTYVITLLSDVKLSLADVIKLYISEYHSILCIVEKVIDNFGTSYVINNFYPIDNFKRIIMDNYSNCINNPIEGVEGEIENTFFCMKNNLPFIGYDCGYFATLKFTEKWNNAELTMSLINIESEPFCKTTINNVSYYGYVISYNRSVSNNDSNLYKKISPYYIDNITEIYVNVESGELESISIEDLNTNKNIIFIENEIIRFLTVEKIHPKIYKLTNILRGCFSSEAEILSDIVGKSFYIYNDYLLNLPIPSSYRGKEIIAELCSVNEDIQSYSFKIDEKFSCIPRPVHFEYNNINCDIEIRWIPRNHYIDGVNLVFLIEITKLSTNEIVRSFAIHDNMFVYTKEQQSDDTMNSLSDISISITPSDGAMRPSYTTIMSLVDKYSFNLYLQNNAMIPF